LAQQHPYERLKRIRNHARDIAVQFGVEERFTLIEGLFAALGTSAGRAGRSASPLLAAMADGRGWDNARLARLAELAEQLGCGALDPPPGQLPITVTSRVREQAFFEAYLSNYIEGAEFTVDESLKIVYDRQVAIGVGPACRRRAKRRQRLRLRQASACPPDDCVD